MPPDRILFIRHAEQHATPGFEENGRADGEGLTIRGWQRAGALVALFARPALRPDLVFTSTVGPDSPSKRPGQTIGPLVRAHGIPLVQRHAKTETDALAADLMTRAGTVLVCWEHSQIAKTIAALPNPPHTPEEWPGDRYDLVWTLARNGTGWTFDASDQRLLAGDAGIEGTGSHPIP